MRPCIAIAPGGWRGFYTLGIMAFVKRAYIIDDVVIGGASAGAHVAAYALSTRDDAHVVEKIITPLIDVLTSSDGRRDYYMAVREAYEAADLDVQYERAFTTVTTVRTHRPFIANSVECNFESSTAFFDSLTRSSFVPGLFGSLGVRRHRSLHLDGAITQTSEVVPDDCTPLFYVSHTMFGRTSKDVGGMWAFDALRAFELVRMGFADAHEGLPDIVDDAARRTGHIMLERVESIDLDVSMWL